MPITTSTIYHAHSFPSDNTALCYQRVWPPGVVFLRETLRPQTDPKYARTPKGILAPTNEIITLGILLDSIALEDCTDLALWQREIAKSASIEPLSIFRRPSLASSLLLPANPPPMAALVQADLSEYLRLVASGKVREIYEIDDSSLLFVTTDRISGKCLDSPAIWNFTHGMIAYDVVLKNVRLQIHATCRYNRNQSHC